jgi:sugar-specific transcriptional regulator TrmB
MTTQSDTYIISALQRLGLSTHEAVLYKTCLLGGELGILDLAKRTGISRTTIYGVADELVKKGLLRFIQKRAHRIYSAEDPHKLEAMVEKAKATVERRAAFLESILPTLSMQYLAVPNKPLVSYYEGQAEVRKLFEDFLHSGATEILFIGGAATIQEALGEKYLKEYIRQRIKAGIKARGIRTKEDEVDEPLYRHGHPHLRSIRIAPAHIKAPVYTGIYGNKVFFISSLAESYGVLVESRDLSQMLRSWFEVLWSVSEPT